MTERTKRDHEREERRARWAALKLALAREREFPKWNEDDLLRAQQSRYPSFIIKFWNWRYRNGSG